MCVGWVGGAQTSRRELQKGIIVDLILGLLSQELEEINFPRRKTLSGRNDGTCEGGCPGKTVPKKWK